MKKYFVLTVSMILFSFLMLSVNSDAQNGKGKGKNCGNGTHQCTNFADANNDGKCDNATGNCSGTCKGEAKGSCGTKSGNGNCGNKANAGVCDGTGKNGQHNCTNFVDANSDGKCDKFADANNDGKCDNKAATCDGTGKGKGKKMGKGNCCSTTTNNNNATLNSNYPNPVIDNTKISFNLKSKSDVKVTVSDSNGNLVKEVYNGKLDAGDHNMDLNVNGLNPGNYFYSLTVGGKVQSKQMIIVK